MINWEISTNSNRVGKIMGFLLDITIVKTIINNINDFEEYIDVVEEGETNGKQFPERLTRKLINNV
ncbi:MAG: hypothetical protein ACOC1K_02565 [Nanoarchaeota archaeon]